MNKNYFLTGIFSQELIEAIAMAGHLDLVKPADIMTMLNTQSREAVQTHLEGLIKANAPAFKASRETA